MQSYVILEKKELPSLPDKFYCDGRFDPGLLEFLIKSYSEKNDTIFDPFCGFGSTIQVAEKLNRVGYGMEIDLDRYNYGLEKINNKSNFINDNILNIDNYSFPEFNLCITSPTYSWKNMGYNPFNNKESKDFYIDYLNYFKLYFEIISKKIKDNGTIIIDTSNINIDNVSTTLAWDVKNTLEELETMRFMRELVVCWKNSHEEFMGGQYGFGYDHSYCLIYKKRL